MLSNFFQKPSGTLAVLVAAVAGPYAAFETDVGTSARRIFYGLVGDSFTEESGNSGSSYLAPSSYGPVPVDGIGGGGFDSPSLNYQYQGQVSPGLPQMGQATYPTTATHVPGYPSPTSQGNGMAYQGTYPPIPTGLPPNASPPGHFVSAPLSQAMPGSAIRNDNGYGNPTILESHRGQSNMVAGGTHQLWDYTLGVPTMQQLQTQPQAIGGGEVHDLREVLRFDITPGWLPQRFSRVTTVLSNVQMDGLRVPLITGTNPSDLAGTLTYFFDSRQSLQRLNLHGLTGDPSQLANLMVQFYGLQPEQSLGGQLFTRRWNNRVISVLHVAPAPIMYAGADHSKYIVFLELNQASSNFALSEEAAGMLQGAQASQRW